MNHFNIRRLSLIAFLTGTFLTRPTSAIELGDPAPALQIDQWVKGQAVDLKAGQGKNIYVVEFWATWCPPCRTSIPHLTEVQAKFKDKGVVIIGVTDEKASVVKPFVKKMGEQMEYTVAIDKDRQTYAAYMGAFGVGGIPHAFIVNKAGKLIWHGHPMSGLDKILEQILAGTYNMDTAKRAAQAEQLISQYLTIISTGKESPEAAKMGREIVANLGEDAEALNNFSWYILTSPRARYRDLDLAVMAAKKAYDATAGKDATVTDTYARALFDTGKVGEAIQMQKQAIQSCEDKDLKASLEETLDRYQRKADAK